MKIHIYPKSMLETVWQQDKLLFTPEAEQPPLCLRCGQPLDHRLVINALSRYADVHICEACGMDEALRDANRCPLPLTEWAAVKNGLSQQQTDFEDPLLTTSCTFEDLFQQGSRPASEIAYSRSDYDGWKWWTTWHQCQKSAPILEAAHEIDASIALINRAASDYGDSVIAGMGAVTRITSMGTLVVFGFLKGFQPIAGFSYGAKKFDRLREAIKTSIIWSTSFCLVVGLVMAAFSTQIISQFTEGDVQMILAGQKSLFANGLTFIFFGFYTVYSSLFLALGKGAAGFFLGSCRQGICFVPVILLLPMVWGMNGILYAQPIADIISVVITLFMAIHLHKEISIAESRTKTIT